MRLIDRFILSEIVPMFFFGVLAFTGLILGAGVLYEIIRTASDLNANFLVVAQIFLLRMPQVVAYTFPMATLFCILLGFNRMSSDSEITAFMSAGVSFVRLMIPVVIFGFLVSLATVLLNEMVVPKSNNRFNHLMHEIRNDIEIENVIEANRHEGKVQSILYAEKAEGTHFFNLKYTELEDGKIVRETLAEEAVYKRTHWLFRNGYEIFFDASGEPRAFVKFPEMNIIFDEGLEDIAREKLKAGNYTYQELRERIKLREKQGEDQRTIRRLKVDYYSKLSIPFASFAFVLIAAPLGLKPQRTGSSVGLGVSVIIIFIYYITQQTFRGLGQSVMPPMMAAWLPNILLCVVGLWFIYKASR